MTGEQPAREMVQGQPAGEWLASRSAARPDAVAAAGRIIADGHRSNDSALHGRQVFERKLGADPDTVFTKEDYLLAAAHLDGIAPCGHSEVLETIASADAEAQASWSRWQKRYIDRPDTREERNAAAAIRTGTVIEHGSAFRGIDGGWYGRAYYAGTKKPAIVVTSSSMGESIIAFPSLPDAKDWAASRGMSQGPVLTTATSPVAPRLAREEEILAWLLRSPRDTPSVVAGLGPGAMTSHLRAELLDSLAWVTATGGTPDYEVIADAYTRRLLRAPGWAAGDIGWPGATRALTYMQRLVATSVTSGQVRDAVVKVADADVEAASLPQPETVRTAVSGPAIPAARPQPVRERRQAPALLQPPPVPGTAPVFPVQQP